MGFIQGPLFFTTHAFITFICPLIFAVIVARAKPRREWNLRLELTPFQRFHKVQTFGRHYDILIFQGAEGGASVLAQLKAKAMNRVIQMLYRCYTACYRILQLSEGHYLSPPSVLQVVHSNCGMEKTHAEKEDERVSYSTGTSHLPRL